MDCLSIIEYEQTSCELQANWEYTKLRSGSLQVNGL